MLLLSSILGPAKPPVASREDVASAPGVYRISTMGDSWVATTNGFDAGGEHPQQLLIGAGERCLICLCEYEVHEEVRQLSRCQHVYHRECIDEVSSSGLGVQSLHESGERSLSLTSVPHDYRFSTITIVSESGLTTNYHHSTVAHHGAQFMSALSRARRRRAQRFHLVSFSVDDVISNVPYGISGTISSAVVIILIILVAAAVIWRHGDECCSRQSKL